MLAILAAIFELATQGLPPAILHRPYTPPPLQTTGGGWCPLNQARHRVVSGSLPPGLILTPAGYFEGVPRQAGVYLFTIRTENDCSVSHRRMAVEVLGAPIFYTSRGELALKGSTPASFLVSSDWPDLPYTLETDTPWLIVSAQRGATPPAGSPLSGDLVTISADTSKLKPGTYRAVVRISAWQATNQPEVRVSISVSENYH